MTGTAQAVQPQGYQALESKGMTADQKTAHSMMKTFDMSPEALTVAKKVILAHLPPQLQTMDNLVLALGKCKGLGLNPLTGHLYLFESQGKMLAIVHYSAAHALCLNTGELQVCEYQAVYEGEECEVDFAGKTVKHVGKIGGRKGQPIGAYATVARAETLEEAKNPDNRTVIWAPFRTYAKSTSDKSAWATTPETMIGKTALMLALRKMFPDVLAGIYIKEEFGGETIEVVANEPTATRADTADALLGDVIEETPKPTDDPSGDAPTSHGDEAQATQPEDKGAAAEQPIADTTRPAAAPESTKQAKKKKATAAPQNPPADDLFANTTDPNNIKQTVANMHKALVEKYGEQEVADVADDFSDLMLDEQVEILEGAKKVLVMRHAGD